MTLDEILAAIEELDISDVVPVMEVLTAKLATNFGYADSYSVPAEEVPAEEVVEEAPVEEVVEESPEEVAPEELWRLSL